MTPEQIKRVRPSEGWARHERRRKAAERRTATPLLQTLKTEVPPDPRSKAWITVNGVIQKKFVDQPDLLTLFRRQNPFFRRFFNGRYDISMGIGPSNFETLVQEYLNDPNSPSYNPDLFDHAAPILRTITAETDRMSPSKRGTGARK